MSLESFLSAFNAFPVAVQREVSQHILASWRDFSEAEYAELLEQAKAGGLSEPEFIVELGRDALQSPSALPAVHTYYPCYFLNPDLLSGWRSADSK